MSAYGILQATIIGALVAWSLWFAARRLLPTASRRLQSRIAAWFERESHAAWLQKIGRAMHPQQVSSGGCGSSGCSSCGSCAPAAPVEAQPLAFRPRANP